VGDSGLVEHKAITRAKARVLINLELKIQRLAGNSFVDLIE
jgi:hypothetical protein